MINRSSIRPSNFFRALHRLGGDRRGVAAIEFAFIVPVLLSLYFVTMEVSQGIETNKKIGRVASTVADLVTQLPREIKSSQIDAIMKIGEAIVQPYNRSTPRIHVTAIRILDDASPVAKVEWSRKLVDGAASSDIEEGAETTVPDTLDTGGTFLIKVDTYLDYHPVIAWNPDQKAALGLFGAFDEIPMRETYYLRPRMTQEILCDDC
ncbi:MAG TPA: TadE/TadG family type IV pilus assembly protein [Rhizobiaceae bacterium]|nr:TadE/TadG family type IV pilus assembly protein [Rhizobiaceae bacterium]